MKYQEYDTPSGKRSLGQVAYERYVESVNFISVNGDPLPLWNDLPTKISQAWENAAISVQNTVSTCKKTK